MKGGEVSVLSKVRHFEVTDQFEIRISQIHSKG